jgi:hypothetical protein
MSFKPVLDGYSLGAFGFSILELSWGIGGLRFRWWLKLKSHESRFLISPRSSMSFLIGPVSGALVAGGVSIIALNIITHLIKSLIHRCTMVFPT